MLGIGIQLKEMLLAVPHFRTGFQETPLTNMYHPIVSRLASKYYLDIQRPTTM